MFSKQQAPLISTVEHTYKRLISYHIAVWFVTIVALLLQLVLGLNYFLYGIMQVALAVVFSSALVASYKIVKKEPLNGYRDYMPIITQALLAGLLLPTQAPFYMIVSTILLIRLIEYVFKKLFKKNIIHPVLLSILIIQLIFRESLEISETMLTIFNEDTLTLGKIRLLFGLYEGLTLGTSAFLILGVLWIYLSVTKIIHLKMSLSYVIHILIGVTAIAALTHYTLWNTFSLLVLGYTSLVLVFFVAEPTSTPETDEMMVLYPFIAVLLTIWFRLQFDIIEAAIYALVFAQFLTWVIEQFQTRTNSRSVYSLYVLSGIAWIGIIIYLSFI